MADTVPTLNVDATYIPLDSNAAVITPPLTLTPAAGGGFVSNLNQIADAIAQSAKLYYGTQAEINKAQAAAQVAKAQGVNAVQVARTGLPSPQLLLAGGLGLVALLILTGKK